MKRTAQVASMSMTPSSWITPKAAKGVGSTIAGRGLVATAPIGKDEAVAVKGGHIVSTATLRSLSDRLRNSEIQITDDLHLAALADDDYDGSMPCQCGAPDCRGVISGHDWQRQDLQRKYRGYFSWYLQRRISDSGRPTRHRAQSDRINRTNRSEKGAVRALCGRRPVCMATRADRRPVRVAVGQPGRHRGHGGERDGDRDPLQDARAGGCGVREEDSEGHGRRDSTAQQVSAPGTPRGDRREAPGQEQLSEHQVQVEHEADDVVRLVVPGDRAAGELHVVAAQQSGGHGEHASALDEPRRGAAHVPGKLLAEPGCAAAQYEKAGDHDPRIPGIRRREAAELDAECAVSALAQGPGDPRGSERHRAGHAGQRASSHTVRLGPRPRTWPPDEVRRAVAVAGDRGGLAVGQGGCHPPVSGRSLPRDRE